MDSVYERAQKRADYAFRRGLERGLPQLLVGEVLFSLCFNKDAGNLTPAFVKVKAKREYEISVNRAYKTLQKEFDDVDLEQKKGGVSIKANIVCQNMACSMVESATIRCLGRQCKEENENEQFDFVRGDTKISDMMDSKEGFLSAVISVADFVIEHEGVPAESMATLTSARELQQKWAAEKSKAEGQPAPAPTQVDVQI